MAVARTAFTYIGQVPNSYGASFHMLGDLVPYSEPDGMGNEGYLDPLTEKIVQAEHMPSSYRSPYDYAPLQQRREQILSSISRELGNRQPRGSLNPDAWRQINDGG